MTKKSQSKAVRNIALCYVRQSVTRDENDMTSPIRQRAHIQKVCDDNGWTPEWYEDIQGHRSGTSEKNRPGWLALKARLGDPDVVALVANDLSRLHRKGWRIGNLLELIEEYGIRLITADPNKKHDFDSSMGRVMTQIAAIFDEVYAEEISQRAKSSVQFRKKRGISIGKPPFGTIRNKTDGGYLIPSPYGAWLMPDGSFVAGDNKDNSPVDGAIWRSYYECALYILRLYAYEHLGREKISRRSKTEGWAYCDRHGQPAPFESDDIRRITMNWIEYGGIVPEKTAKHRPAHEIDVDTVPFNEERAVFDVELLRAVGRKLRERTHKPYDRGHKVNDFPYPLAGITYCAQCEQNAAKENNLKLRSRLGGKSESTYRHKPGQYCGCKQRSVSRELLEGQFNQLVQALIIKPEYEDALKDLALDRASLLERGTNV